MLETDWRARAKMGQLKGESECEDCFHFFGEAVIPAVGAYFFDGPMEDGHKVDGDGVDLYTFGNSQCNCPLKAS